MLSHETDHRARNRVGFDGFVREHRVEVLELHRVDDAEAELVRDPAFADPTQWTWMPKLEQSSAIKYGAAVAGALLVLAIGKYMAAKNPPPAEAA